MKPIIRRLMPLFFIQIVFAIVHSLTVAAFPLIEKWFIDDLSGGVGLANVTGAGAVVQDAAKTVVSTTGSAVSDVVGAIATGTGATPSFLERIALPLVIYLALIALNALSQSGTRIMEWKIGSRFTTLINTALFKALLGNRELRNATETAEFVNMLEEDVEALEEDYVSAWLDFWINVIILVLFSASIVLYLDWRVLLVIVLGSATICGIPYVFKGVLSKKRKDSIAKQKNYLHTLMDLLGGKRQYNADNQSGFHQRHEAQLTTAQSARFRFGSWRTISDTTTDVGTEVVRLATLLICFYLFATGQMEIGGVFASIAYASNFLAPIESMISSLNAIFSVGESKEAVEEYLCYGGADGRDYDTENGRNYGVADVRDYDTVNDRNYGAKNNRDYNAEDGQIYNTASSRNNEPVNAQKNNTMGGSFKALTLTDVVIERDDLEIGPIQMAFALGEHTLISGRNGVGKSSLLAAMMGDLDYTGTIAIDGTNIEEMQRYPLVQSVRVEEHVFAADLRENITYFGSTKLDAALVEAYLAVLDAKTRQRLEECSSCAELSSGEKQIVALLRALNAGPRLLILDEALASVDAVNKVRLRAFVKQRVDGIVEVAHDITDDEKRGIDREWQLLRDADGVRAV